MTGRAETPEPPRHRPLRRLARWLRDRRATTAVEFTLIAVPFMALLFIIVETGYVFFLAFLMEGATANGARQIRLGETQAVANPIDRFKSDVCGRLLGFVPCEQLVVDVKNYGSFNDSTSTEGGEDNAGPGGPGAVVAVSVSYQYHLITPGLRLLVPNTQNNMVSLVSTATFRNEPFPGAAQ